MHRSYRQQAQLLGGVLLIAVMFLVVQPRETAFEPLPWDMSHHYYGAQQLAYAVSLGDWSLVGEHLQARDQYPPGHSVLLGLWLLAFGESNRSWLLFQFVSMVMLWLAVWCCCLTLPDRRRPLFLFLTTILMLSTSPVLALASSFMVEVPATTMAVLSVALLVSLVGRVRWKLVLGAMMACLIMIATLVTKYNIGLPLLPAALVLAGWQWWHHQRSSALMITLATLVALLAWVGFLSYQDHGWESFLAFAENRSNTEGMGILERIGLYLEILAAKYAPHPVVAGLVGVLAIVALSRRPQPLVMVTGAYILGTFAALARHTYVLERNLFTTAIMVIILASGGLALVLGENRWTRWTRWMPNRWFLASASLSAIALLAIAAGSTSARIGHQYQGDDPDLTRASRFVAEEFASPGSCRVVGTFNQLSSGWFRILASRSDLAPGQVQIDFSYPLPRSRSGFDARPDHLYGEAVARWIEHAEDRVITIEVDNESTWWSSDYQNHSSWKRNYIDEIARQSELECVRSLDLDDGGLKLRVYEPVGRDIRFGVGWGNKEDWGRWALAQRTILNVRNTEGTAKLRLKFAAFEGMAGPQDCVVLVDGVLVDCFEVDGRPWQWQERLIGLPRVQVGTMQTVELRFEECWEAGGRLRALPFADISLEGVVVGRELGNGES